MSKTKKIFLKITCVILSSLLFFSFSSCIAGGLNGGNAYLYDKVEKDGYTYYYYNKEYYHLIGDKRENNPEKWFVEPYLDGIEIRYFGAYVNYGLHGGSVYVPSLQNVEELYLPYNMKLQISLESSDYVIGDQGIIKMPKKITLVNNMEDSQHQDNGFALFGFSVWKEPLSEVYLTPIGYEYRIRKMLEEGGIWTREEYPSGEYCFYREDGHYINWFIKICKANTSYMFNYENSPNDDYFFIRDYEYGEKVENVPYEPRREGYTFGGWYKEAECINEWNFEKDTLPETLYNENNEEVYQETKLYAKWIENPQEEKEQEEKKTWWDSVLDFFGLKNRRII